jgi:hypothetical protein
MRLWTTCAACHTQLAVAQPRQVTCRTCPARREPVVVLEDQFLAAVLAGQAEEADRLAALLDGWDRRPARLAEAAEVYAGWGWPVFPCTPGHKRPLVPRRAGGHGLHDATTDPEQVAAWWRRSPQANIGIATGHRFDVLDIDPEGLPRWVAVAEDLDLDVHGQVGTPRGGLHLYLTPQGGGSAAALGRLAGWDYRGLGGYVLVPPSTLVAGALKAPLPTGPLRYSWLSKPSPVLVLAGESGGGPAGS